ARARGFRGHGERTGSVHERSKIRRGKHRDRWGLRARLHARPGQARERARRAAAARGIYGRDVRAAPCADAHQGGLRQHQALSKLWRHAAPRADVSNTTTTPTTVKAASAIASNTSINRVPRCARDCRYWSRDEPEGAVWFG